MLDVDVHITPKAEEIGIRFQIKESNLAEALSRDEAKDLVNALADQHGVSIFADVADDVVKEFGPEPEEA
jgi:hypothetical protein